MKSFWRRARIRGRQKSPAPPYYRQAPGFSSGEGGIRTLRQSLSHRKKEDFRQFWGTRKVRETVIQKVFIRAIEQYRQVFLIRSECFSWCRGIFSRLSLIYFYVSIFCLPQHILLQHLHLTLAPDLFLRKQHYKAFAGPLPEVDRSAHYYPVSIRKRLFAIVTAINIGPL